MRTPIPLSAYNTLQNYNNVIKKLRSFFLERNFLEVDTQSRRSILAACEDPATVATYTFAGVTWPLPQTGQMWLEYELLKNPDVPGLFCLTTSYRNEPRPIPERHLTIFPQFEFETHGDMNTLQCLIEDLCVYLGFGEKSSFREGDYQSIADYYNVKDISAAVETNIQHDFSHVFLLKNFPFYTHPFFNMKKEGDRAKKIDTLLYGMETIGSAERSCNVDEMRELFYTISHGMYSKLLFDLFSRERVEKELDEFLSLDFFTRCGGGIGVSRLIRAMTIHQEGPEHSKILSTKIPIRQQMV
jgi:aspartyl/asparaginyl-tRNA synthetase